MLANPATSRDRNLFHPDYLAKSVSDIDFPLLEAKGIKYALVDLDGTVVSHGMFDVSQTIKELLKRQSLRIYIATNRPRSRSLKNLRHDLHAAGVIHPKGVYIKPFPQYYSQAIVDYQINPKEAVMIGDRLIQDIFGANLAGMTTIMVRKLGAPKNIFDASFSKLEMKYFDRLANKYKVDSKT